MKTNTLRIACAFAALSLSTATLAGDRLIATGGPHHPPLHPQNWG